MDPIIALYRFFFYLPGFLFLVIYTLLLLDFSAKHVPPPQDVARESPWLALWYPWWVRSLTFRGILTAFVKAVFYSLAAWLTIILVLLAAFSKASRP